MARTEGNLVVPLTSRRQFGWKLLKSSTMFVNRYRPLEPSTPERECTMALYDMEKNLRTFPSNSEVEGLKLHSNPSANNLITDVIQVEDDPTLSPWTFRMWLLGLSLSLFASTVTTISTFKPQPIRINLVFLVVLSHVLGRVLEKIMPRKGRIGRLFNPHAFNIKEQSAIVLMAGAAATTAEPMLILAVQKLWYDINPAPIIGLALVFSAQMVGYGICGFLLKAIVHPSHMVWPSILPVNSLLETLHRDKVNSASRMRVFYVSFAALFVWQVFPQYIMPLLAGVSILCLSNRRSMLFTRLFGGSMGNEGLGFLSLSFDWQMIAGEKNPLWVPLQTLTNEFGGYLISIALYMGLFYSNAWNAQNLPFLSPMLFDQRSSSRKYVPYDVKKILNRDTSVNMDFVKKMGLPFFTASTASSHTTTNIAIAATVSHMLCWNWNDLKSSWSHEVEPEKSEAIDPHYALVAKNYKTLPTWWFGVVWIVSVVVGLIAIHVGKTGLPWWAFALAILIGNVLVVFFAAMKAIFGFELPVVVFIQMVGAYLVPRRPIANMYFAAYGFNSLQQAKHMLESFKVAQYAHLAPRCAFTVQIVGTAVGCLMSYLMMEKITTEKMGILKAVEGSNVWSGQALQDHSALAIAWGGLATELFSFGKRYQMVPLGFLIGVLAPLPFYLLHRLFPKSKLNFSSINTAIIAGSLANLAHGSHSSFLVYYALGFFSQFYIRKYKTDWFLQYNYILSAGMDGGAAVIGFILTFTVFGAGGLSVPFPPWFGNHFQGGRNYDYCMKDPAL
ncbi:hypothetical protein FKW77_001200 [Venturia effusa]|uniref:OPT superfamily oligopeptide transporter n=1 Tax=Venturia effusa TaxID=50376 RepID=A0A517LJU0_9PEZI|nr:hypothetical protein FKW77_001200 [Venturia effusa]